MERQRQRGAEVRKRETSNNESKPLEGRDFCLTRFTYSELIISNSVPV